MIIFCTLAILRSRNRSTHSVGDPNWWTGFINRLGTYGNTVKAIEAPFEAGWIFGSQNA